MATRFKDLAIGDTFDFVGPDPMLNSFYARCRKISARGYRDDKRTRYTVGSASVEVFHVNDPEWTSALPNPFT